ncbi:MAG: response regulator transcription factor [Firmicutes bacterium]|nr:response regulator transcription factor [Bacillota bacterium]
MNAENRGTILVVDDEPDIREILRVLLADDGYTIREAANGAEALEQIAEDLDLVILDVMMPGENGFAICKAIRERSNVPVLFLTARSQEMDKVLGLRYGGDDYLSKPFSPSELQARVGALSRRYNVYQGNQEKRRALFVRQNIQIDFDSSAVCRDGVPIVLTDLEYRVLCFLAARAGETIDNRTLYAGVWDEPYLEGSAAGTIMTHIRNLRKKLEKDPANPTLIRNVWGKGYRIDA